MPLLLLSIFSSHFPLLQPYNHCVDISGLSASVSNHFPQLLPDSSFKCILLSGPSLPQGSSVAPAHRMKSKLHSMTPRDWLLPVFPASSARGCSGLYSLAALKHRWMCHAPCSVVLSKTEMPPPLHGGPCKSLDLGVKHLARISTCFLLAKSISEP